MSLIDKHLLTTQETSRSEVRFEMLETIREYAYEQLTASGHLENLQRAFAHHYAGFVSRIAPNLCGPQAFEWADAIAREYENVRATLRWALAQDRALAFRLSINLHYFWSRMGYATEAHEWLEAVGDPRDRADGAIDPKTVWELLNLQALSYDWVRDHSRARELFTEVVAVARTLRDEMLVARSLNNLGGALRGSGEPERARAVHEESLAIKMRHGDQWSIATTLSNLGLALRSCRQYQEALDRHRQALELFRSTNDRWGELAALNDIADVYRDQHEYILAARFYKQSLDANATFRTLAADSFEGLAAVVAERNWFRQAAVLGGAAETVRRETGQSTPPPDRPPFEAACASSRAALGSGEFELARAEGGSLSPAEAIEVARTIAGELIDTVPKHTA
jgi:tetratricopeptide (TPR) repeat protein